MIAEPENVLVIILPRRIGKPPMTAARQNQQALLDLFAAQKSPNCAKLLRSVPSAAIERASRVQRRSKLIGVAAISFRRAGRAGEFYPNALYRHLYALA